MEKTEPRAEYALIDADDFLQLELPQKRKIISPWLMEQSINQVYGYRGTGKTWFGLSLFNAVTSGQRFGPWEIETPVSALYVDGEMSAIDIQDRLNQLPHYERKETFFVYSDAYANSIGLPRASLLNRRWREMIQKVSLEKGIKLLGLDNISTLTAGIDENSKRDWDPINQWFLGLRFAGISTVFFHHTNKAGEQRGTSGREDNLDCSICLQRPLDYVAEEGAKFIIRFKKARVKNIELPSLADIEFTLVEHNGEVEWSWGNVKRKTQAEVLKMLDEGMKQIDIASALGLSRGTVSKIRNKALKDDHITSDGKLTPSGRRIVSLETDEKSDD